MHGELACFLQLKVVKANLLFFLDVDFFEDLLHNIWLDQQILVYVGRWFFFYHFAVFIILLIIYLEFWLFRLIILLGVLLKKLVQVVLLIYWLLCINIDFD